MSANAIGEEFREEECGRDKHAAKSDLLQCFNSGLESCAANYLGLYTNLV